MPRRADGSEALPCCRQASHPKPLGGDDTFPSMDRRDATEDRAPYRRVRGVPGGGTHETA